MLTLVKLDDNVQQYIKALRKAGTPVNNRIVMAAAEGIVRATDRIEHGGHIKLTLDWAYSILRRMGYVQRKATTKARTILTQSEFDKAKKRYLHEIKRTLKDGKIPPDRRW